jgi:hypothetical protein
LIWRAGVIALAIFVGSFSSAGVVLDSARAHFRNPGIRRFGMEIEYKGLSLVKAAEIAHNLLGGTVTFDKIENLDRMTLKGSIIGDLVIKVETNMVKDNVIPPPEEWVCEIVAPPLRYIHLHWLQSLVTQLHEAGAIGTEGKNPVSVQTNLEILHPEAELSSVLKLTRFYLDPQNHQLILEELGVPKEERMKFLGPYSAGMMKKLLDPNYHLTPARQVFDDFFYRQILELETGDAFAWSKSIDAVKRQIRQLGYPRNAQAIKLNSLRLSSLLMYLFPKDPYTKAIQEDAWAYARPLIEFRDENNNWDIMGPVERAYGMYLMANEISNHNPLSECEDGLKKAVGL